MYIYEIKLEPQNVLNYIKIQHYMYLQAHFSKYPNVEFKNVLNFTLLAFRNIK